MVAVVVAFGLYLVALNLWRDTVPAGLNNDAAEETLRGIYLLETGQFEVLSSSIGIPQETLYLYVVAGVTRLVGSTTLAIHLLSWCVALACLWLVAQLTRRVDATIPLWVPLLLASSSIWLFHYARAGVRAISVPLFALAVCSLLDRAERARPRWGPALACGAILGLSLYAYTSCRALAVAFMIYALVRLFRCREQRRSLLRCYGLIVVAALLVSVPNLLLLLDDPGAFLLRGSYVVRGGLPAGAGHILWSVLLPVYYPDAYRVLVGPTHIFDGVSAGLTAAGIDPLHPIAAGALLIGLFPAWRFRAHPIVFFLMCVWLTAVVLLGFSGPSLTRLLILLPVFLVGGALGIGAVLQRLPSLRPAVAALLIFLLAYEAYAYFFVFARSAEAQSYFSPVATPLGQRARELASGGLRVVCVVAKDANVVRYLTHDQARGVHVVEFYRRPLDPARIPITEFAPHVLLIERAPAFSGYRAAFPREREVGTHQRFDEIRLTRTQP